MSGWWLGDHSGWASLARTTAPADGPVVTLAQAKAQCRIDHPDDDDYLNTLIGAAVAHIDGPYGAGVPLLTQSWRLSLDRWPLDSIIVPLSPVLSIDKITYVDLAYTLNTLASSLYVYDLDAQPVRIRRSFGSIWPITGLEPGAVKVDFTCGLDPVPADIQHAILLLVSHWYQNREAVVGVENRDSSTIMPLGVDAILDRYRAGRIA